MKANRMKNETNIKSWDAMNNDEKLDRLTSVLTRAGSDVRFRDRCLSSAESAKQAVSEESTPPSLRRAA